ncbi:MAG: YqeG family HAD IIIA-type phosphatase [Oscillatoriales cyanobacterium SM2_2_1]|nr:YqeG family HAD IIIA-type phosphatase [Oscillatoriales cyanobacterium SM2_2_1]
MRRLLAPNLVLPHSVTALTAGVMIRHHLRALILDVDNTLVADHETLASPAIVAWVESMRGYPMWLVSNNFNEQRIGAIAQQLNIPYHCRAAKPSRRRVRQAVEALNLPLESIAMVGDRLLTDTVVGNRLGLFTILVLPPGATTFQGWRSATLRTCERWLARQVGVSL